MNKIDLDGAYIVGNGGDGIHVVGDHNISMKGTNISGNQGHGVAIYNDTFFKENGLNLAINSAEFQNLIETLKNLPSETRQNTIIQRIIPYIEPSANMVALLTGIISLVNSI